MKPQQIGVLLICCMSLFIVGLDITAVNVALPSIAGDLDADIAGLQWTVSAYTVVMASLLMFSGSMADRLGRKRIFVTGLTVFSAASLLCSLAPSVELLVVSRVLQGVGASMLNPVAMSIITNTFTEPRERAQAVGIWGAVFGIAMALGPIVGGGLVATAGWPWIFLINVPLGLAAIVLTLRFVPESRAPRPRRFDPVGQLLFDRAAGLGDLRHHRSPGRGWSSPASSRVLVAAAALVALLLYEPRREDPLVDLRFFRSVPFSSAIAISVAAFATFGGFLFLNTLYLQDVRGLSPVEAGLATVPMALMTRGDLTPVGPHRRPPRPAPAAADRRRLLGGRLRDAHRHRPGDLARVAGRDLHRLRDRLRVRQRADHQRRRVRHAAGPGRRRRRDRHDLPAVRPDARGGGRRGDRHARPAADVGEPSAGGR